MKEDRKQQDKKTAVSQQHISKLQKHTTANREETE
jgi:hypothetical protein